MNIIILNDYAAVQGGAAQVAVQSALGLAQQGHKITFVFASGEADPLLDHSNIQCISLNQYDLLNNPSKLNAAWKGLWNRPVEEQLKLILNDFDPSNTIVHVHSWVKALSISAVACVLRKHFPMVMTLHDYFSVCPNGGFYNYRHQQICNLKPMSMACLISNCDVRNYPQKLWRYTRQLIYKSAKFPSSTVNFITVSDFSQNLLKPYLPKQAQYWRISNPIEVEHLPPATPHTSKMYTFIGRLSPEKGASLLTKLKFLPQEQLRFIGTGELEAWLKVQLPNAQFLGWCDKAQITKYLNDTRALLFTSQLYETQGLVVAEAASRGIPSIISDATAAQEFVENNKTGLLFKSGDPTSLEQQIMKLESNDDLVQKMGILTYERYWQNPSTLKLHVHNLLSCYQEIINKHQ